MVFLALFFFFLLYGKRETYKLIWSLFTKKSLNSSRHLYNVSICIFEKPVMKGKRELIRVKPKKGNMNQCLDLRMISEEKMRQLKTGQFRHCQCHSAVSKKMELMSFHQLQKIFKGWKRLEISFTISANQI